MNGLVAYGVYVPYYRLDRKAIGDALGVASGKGTRAVASYDEDTTSMAVEAARAALRARPASRPAPCTSRRRRRPIWTRPTRRRSTPRSA